MQGATSIHRCAMFSTARCALPVHPRPRAAVPSRLRAPALTAVSARPRRGGARRDRSWDDDGGGGGGGGDEDAIDESFFGDPRDEEVEPEEEDPPARGRRAAAAPDSPAGQLRGSDVLRALQRAAAAKMEAKKRNTKRNAGARPAVRRNEKGVSGGGVKPVEVAGEVRPIEIRLEWAPRIRELELRVQQLLDKHHQ